jgi:hypothetical protein
MDAQRLTANLDPFTIKNEANEIAPLFATMRVIGQLLA